MTSPLAPVTLAELAPMRLATIASIEWHKLSASESRRLREFGLDEGVEVELLQRSGLFRGPMSARIGRMTIAVRRHVGEAIHVVQAA